MLASLFMSGRGGLLHLCHEQCRFACILGLRLADSCMGPHKSGMRIACMVTRLEWGRPVLTYVCRFIRLLVLIGYLYSIGVAKWGPMNKYHKDTCLKEFGLHFQFWLTTLHSIVNTIKKTYVRNQQMYTSNNHVYIKRSLLFQRGSLLMFYHRFVV